METGELITREGLECELRRRKEKNPRYSLRAFASYLGVSRSALSDFLTGKRSLSITNRKKISDRLNLVWADKDGEAPRFLNLEEERFSRVAKWYHFALLCVARTNKNRFDIDALSKSLSVPGIQIHEALLDLLELGLIDKKGTRFFRSGLPIRVGDRGASAVIRRFHKESLQLVAERIDKIPVERRRSQTLFIATDKIGAKRIQAEMSRTQRRIAKLAGASRGDEVFLFSAHFIPVEE